MKTHTHILHALITFIFFILFLTFDVLVPKVDAGCNGGFITGAYYNRVCTPTNCDPVYDLNCSCSNTCNVALYGEYCSDNTEPNSCNSVDFTGMDCGSKGKCTWSGPNPNATSTPIPTTPPGQPTNTPAPQATATPPPVIQYACDSLRFHCDSGGAAYVRVPGSGGTSCSPVMKATGSGNYMTIKSVDGNGNDCGGSWSGDNSGAYEGLAIWEIFDFSNWQQVGNHHWLGYTNGVFDKSSNNAVIPNGQASKTFITDTSVPHSYIVAPGCVTAWGYNDWQNVWNDIASTGCYRMVTYNPAPDTTAPVCSNFLFSPGTKVNSATLTGTSSATDDRGIGRTGVYIFTTSGNFIKEIQNNNTSNVLTTLSKTWDLKDAVGNNVPNGDYEMQFNWYDPSGNMTQCKRTFTVDRTPPVCGAWTFSPSSPGGGASVVITARASDVGVGLVRGGLYISSVANSGTADFGAIPNDYTFGPQANGAETYTWNTGSLTPGVYSIAANWWDATAPGNVGGHPGNFVQCTSTYTVQQPTNLIRTCAPAGNSATFSWNGVNGVSNYILRINNSPSGDWFNGAGGDQWACISGTSTTKSVIHESNYTGWSVQSANAGCTTGYGTQTNALAFSCTDTLPPPVPADTLSCAYSYTGASNGIRYYTITNSWNAVTDNGAAGMHIYPYWSQASLYSDFNTLISGWYNSWVPQTSRTSVAYASGTRIYTHVRSRDSNDNQSAWSATKSIILNTANCTGNPTSTPIPSFTPVPTATRTPTPTIYPAFTISGRFKQVYPTGTSGAFASATFPIPAVTQVTTDNHTRWSVSRVAPCATAIPVITRTPPNGYGYTIPFVFPASNATDGDCRPDDIVPPSQPAVIVQVGASAGRVAFTKYAPISPSPMTVTAPGTYNLDIWFQYTGTGWARFKDTSFTKAPVSTFTNNPVPYILESFDNGVDDSGDRGTIDEGFAGSGGFVAGNVDGEPLDTSSASNKWVLSAPLYTMNPATSPIQTSVSDILNRTPVTAATLVSSNLSIPTDQLSVFTGSSLTVNQISSASAASQAVLIVVNSTGALADITINANTDTSAKMIIARNITIGPSVTSINAILIASGTIDFGGGNVPLKIKGNILAGGGLIGTMRNRSDGNMAKSSVFIVFDPTQYLRLLPIIKVR